MKESSESLNGIGRKISGFMMWEGVFKNDKLHGLGRLIDSKKSKIYEGFFNNGWIQNEVHQDKKPNNY
jgi:hypothetical protein